VFSQFPDPGFKVVTRNVTKSALVSGIGDVRGRFPRAQRLQLFAVMARQRHRFGLAMFVCIVGICSAPAHAAKAGTGPVPASRVAADVIALTNVERTHHRRGPLRANARLMRAAQLQAEQMAQAGQMAHVLPRARYPRTEDRIAAADYRWYTVGENVAFGQSSAARVLYSWMHSDGHRANILNSSFTEMGAGYAVDRTGRPYYVQVFGRPRPRSLS
jgi:uncharacterized protein YkwD